MKKILIAFVILAGIATASTWSVSRVQEKNIEVSAPESAQAQENQGNQGNIAPPVPSSDAPLAWPLKKGEERAKKLTFGLYVTPNPEENPINPPERFTGYHTALDLEVLDEEEAQEVPVFAACDGTVLQTGEIAGYGGVLIQSCTLDNEPVTVLYGHLDFTHFKVQTGNTIKRGTKIGKLGDHKSVETGHTRKHLHLGVHKGTGIEVQGYVASQRELQSFIDPLPLLQGKEESI